MANDSEELVKQLRGEVFAQNETEFVERVDRLIEAAGSDNAGPAFKQVLQQLLIILNMHPSEFREMMNDPEARKDFEQFAARIDSLLGK
jgi:hypothetical protein